MTALILFSFVGGRQRYSTYVRIGAAANYSTQLRSTFRLLRTTPSTAPTSRQLNPTSNAIQCSAAALTYVYTLITDNRRFPHGQMWIVRALFADYQRGHPAENCKFFVMYRTYVLVRKIEFATAHFSNSVKFAPPSDSQCLAQKPVLLLVQLLSTG